MLTALHISTSDNIGGSGRSAYRIHTGLARLGVRSRMLVGEKATDDDNVQRIAGVWAPFDHFANRVTGRLSWQYLFFPSSWAAPWRRWVREADVIQLYNTHGGYFSHTVLPFLSRRRPVVWRLSDMWPFTGHCAYSFACEGWRTGCGGCPLLSDAPELYRDTTAQLWRVKDYIYRHSQLTIVAPSQWMAQMARESPLLGRFAVHLIPNGLDTNIFQPLPQAAARQQLDLPPTARIILFSAHSVADKRKGAAAMRQALERLAEMPERPDNLHLLVVGQGATVWATQLPFPVTALEQLDDDAKLAVVYSAADVFVLPTLAENLPNGILESMACGTPSITFNVGGCPDAVRHLETGYLAAYNDAADLARGLSLLLTDEDLRARLRARCRQVSLAEYNSELQAQRFKNLYLDLLQQKY